MEAFPDYTSVTIKCNEFIELHHLYLVKYYKMNTLKIPGCEISTESNKITELQNSIFTDVQKNINIDYLIKYRCECEIDNKTPTMIDIMDKFIIKCEQFNSLKKMQWREFGITPDSTESCYAIMNDVNKCRQIINDSSHLILKKLKEWQVIIDDLKQEWSDILKEEKEIKDNILKIHEHANNWRNYERKIKEDILKEIKAELKKEHEMLSCKSSDDYTDDEVEKDELQTICLLINDYKVKNNISKNEIFNIIAKNIK